MKFSYQLLISSVLLIFTLKNTASAQTSFNENFSGTLAQWQGGVASYAVTAGEAALTTTGSGVAYMSAVAPVRDSVSWSVYFRQNLGATGPSSSNYTRIVLQSDVADVSGAFNGYYLQIGETGNDTIRLYRKNGAVSTKLLSANTGISLNPTVARLQVTRNASGFWQIFVDNAGGTTYVLAASGTDNTFLSGGFFGLQNGFTTTNASGKFFFDDVTISPLFIDNISPTVVTATAITATQIDVLFSEALNASSASTISNYTINNGITVQGAILDGVNTKLVHLTVSNLTSGATYT